MICHVYNLVTFFRLQHRRLNIFFKKTKYFTFQISSLELDSLESSPLFEPEKVRPIFHKLRKKEKSLREKARTLETKLETAETHCYALVEENCELKTEIEVLEEEISEV